MIHREGRQTILISTVILLVIAVIFLVYQHWFAAFALAFSFVIYSLILYFFRQPGDRIIPDVRHAVLSPADGKIVAIERVMSKYFNDHRLQISIFMSPLNVHVNFSPINGQVIESSYHRGKYLVAFHPKSSELNEHHNTVIAHGRHQLLVKQIAGAVARRIINYTTKGKQVERGDEIGFIKFGSRVDVIIPIDCSIKVKLNQKVKGQETILAEMPD